MKEEKASQDKQDKESSNKKSLPDIDPMKLRAIAESVRLYFLEKRVSNLFVAFVLERLARSGQTSNMNRSQIHNHLRIVASKCPQWLTIVINPDGEILRQSKVHQLTDIHQMLES